MDNNLIGSQITKFRKAARITQEELGRAVGVSTQAVSRWECGGAPDVTLLPAIADKLGISIDALFGREGGAKTDLHETVRQWIRSLPAEQAFNQLNRLVWSAVSTMPGDYVNNIIPFPESCYMVSMDGKYENVLNRSILHTDGGVYFGVGGRDFSFSMLCPQPEAGYEAYLPDKESTRAFLTLLAEPGCLEVLEFMLHRKAHYFSASLLAKEIGMEPETVSQLMERLNGTGLIFSENVELLEGTEKVYMLEDSNSSAFLLLEYLLRCIEAPDVLNYMNMSFRKKPLL